MLVIIEGPDGAGKTTLIENLRENAKRYFAILRASGPPRDAAGVPSFNAGLPYMRAAVEFAKSVSFPVVCDRFHAISDPIYSRVIRGAEETSRDRIQVALRHVDLIVYCRPSIATIAGSVQRNAQMDGVIQKTAELVLAYDSLIDALRPNFRIIDYDFEKPDSMEGVKRALFPWLWSRP